MNILFESENIADVVDLNEKFLCLALGGLEVSQLLELQKIELRVDCSQHNL